MHKEALLNLQAPTPANLPPPHPPTTARPTRRACLCQQMSGRRCVFLCLSLHSFHLLLQRLPICLWPRFISSHSSLSPPTNQHPRGQQWVCCVSDTLALFIPTTQSSFPPIPRRTPPPSDGWKIVFLLSPKTRRDPSLSAAPSADLGSKAKPASCQARARARRTFFLPTELRGVNVNPDFPIYFAYILFNASSPTLMTSAERLLKVRLGMMIRETWSIYHLVQQVRPERGSRHRVAAHGTSEGKARTRV